MPNPLLDLKRLGQSIWYDDLNRSLLTSGELQRMVDEDGVTGGTSNPTIFEKAVSGTNAYDDPLRELVPQGKKIPELYDDLTITDVGMSADIFRRAYDETEGRDGFASLEVSPDIAYDTAASIQAAKRLFSRLARPNAMIKIPGTQEGLPAIERCAADGLNINITLLFGVENYEQVAWAYISALEKRVSQGQPVDRIASVASFFVSRVDTLTDQKLGEKIAAAKSDAERRELESLLGKAAVANAKIAYAKFKEIFSSSRWKALEAKGARLQRPLWASTSTKNPKYPDTMYVDPLIGPDSVNTMPRVTLDAFREHGVVQPTIEEGLEEARQTIHHLAEMGIDLKIITDELQVQGVKLFCDSFHKANETLQRKRDTLQRELGAATHRS